MAGKRKVNNLVSWGLAAALFVLMLLYGPGVLILHPQTPRASASALSFVCASSAASTSTAACGGEQAGDLLLIMCAENSGGAAPSLPGGVTSISSLTNTGGSGATRTGMQVGWTTAAGSGSGSGTCGAGTTDTVMMVYRGQGGSPIGNIGTESGSNSGASVSFNSTSLSVSDGSSWFAALAVRNTADSQMATAPSGMINRTSAPATPFTAGHDTNGPTASNWPLTSVSGFSASAKYTSVVVEILASPAITVGAYGTHVPNLTIGTTGNYVGGAFTFARDVGSANVTSIKIHNSGTVNAQTNLANLVLYYKQEASCESTFPTSGTTQFNSTPGGFNASGDSTVTGTLSVDTSQYCFYIKLDVGSGAGSGDTLALQITDPATDVLVSSGSAAPGSAVAIAGSVIITPPGPTTDQILRGGEWFSGGSEQPLFWAQ